MIIIPSHRYWRKKLIPYGKLEKMEFCRGCMTEFSLTERGHCNRKLADKFMYCTQLEYSPDDGLPSEFCQICTDTIPICYRFIKKARSIDTTLRKLYPLDKSDSVDNTDADTNGPDDFATEPDIKIEDDSYEDLGNGKALPEEVNKDTVNGNTDNGEIKKDDLETSDYDNNSDDIKLKDLKNQDTEYEKNVKNILAKVPKRRKKGKTQIECQYCHKPFATQLWYEKHLRAVHIDNTDSKFTCNLCSKSFSRKDILKQHMVTHTDERPHACHLCPKRFKMRKQLNLHLRLHEEQTQFTCHVCNATFQMRAVLNTHLKTHFENKSNLCHLCGAGFTLVGNLAVHMRTHTGEKPYSCSRCSFRCSMSSSLRRHERLHVGSRPHACATCDKKFSDRGGLVRHIRTHTGELPYRCNFCSRSFIDSSKRKRHIMSQHNIPGDLTVPASLRVASSSATDGTTDIKLRERPKRMVKLMA